MVVQAEVGMYSKWAGFVLGVFCVGITACGGGGDGASGEPSDDPPSDPVPLQGGRVSGTISIRVPTEQNVVEAEPNDTFDQSHFLGEVRPGRKLTIFGHTTSDGGDDFDAFRFFVPERTKITVTMKFDDANDFDMGIYDFIAAQYVETFVAETAPETGVFYARGTVDLVVVSFSGEGDYSLEIDAEDPLLIIDEVEPNDNFFDGQYIGQLRAGERVAVGGDASAEFDEWESISFTTDEAINLDIRLTQETDDVFDIYVYDTSPDLAEPELLTSFLAELDSGLLQGEILIPAGRYIQLYVFAFSGDGEYTLVAIAGAPPEPTSVTTLSMVTGPKPDEGLWRDKGGRTAPRFGRSQAEFVHAQALLCARPGRAADLQDVFDRAGCRVVSEIPGGSCCVEFDGAPGSGVADKDVAWWTLCKIAKMQQHDCLRYVEPNYIAKPFAEPNDEFYNLQWHYELINLPAAWDITTGDSDVIVAIIDTGVVDHPELNSRVTGGYDFISDPSSALDGNGVDSDWTDPGSQSKPNGLSSWHGTHVAGTVGALTNNGDGVAGVTWETSLMILRALGRGGGSYDDIANAIRYAARLSNSSGTLPSVRADIINMSLGAPGFSTTLDDAVQAAFEEGVVVVAAAGNSGDNTVHYPAAYDNVISVSAVDPASTLVGYSTFGSTLDVAAPGGTLATDQNGDGFIDGVLSTIYNEQFGVPFFEFLEGTSMASPHVAGVAALMLAVHPDLTPAEVEQVLTSTALDLGATGRDDLYGHGLIDAQRAVLLAQQMAQEEPVLLPPRLTISAASILLERDQTTARIAIGNAGDEFLDVVVAAILESQGDWMAASLVPDGGAGATANASHVEITVDRADLEDGSYFGRILLTSNGGFAVMQVVMVVRAQPPQTPNFSIFVRLVDFESGEIAAQVIANPATTLDFEFEDLAEGTYRLEAGTDEDGDGIFCEAGELCGVYPVSSSPVVIPIQDGDNRSGFKFELTPAQAITDG